MEETRKEDSERARTLNTSILSAYQLLSSYMHNYTHRKTTGLVKSMKYHGDEKRVSKLGGHIIEVESDKTNKQTNCKVNGAQRTHNQL